MRFAALAMLVLSMACGGREQGLERTTATVIITTAESNGPGSASTSTTITFSTAPSCSGPRACGERPCPWPACPTPVDVAEYGVETDASFVCVPWGATCAPVGCAPAGDASDADASIDTTNGDGASDAGSGDDAMCPPGVSFVFDACTPMR